jgi:GLTT repeat-containing protein
MTRLSMTIMLTGTALALLAAAPARSVESGNGLSPNGLSSNGLSPNGLNPNGVNPNGINPNGLSPNGSTGSGQAANSAGEIGRVIAVELPRRTPR